VLVLGEIHVFLFPNKKFEFCFQGGLSFCKCHQLKVAQLCFKLFIAWPPAIIRSVHSVALVLDNDCVVVSYSFIVIVHPVSL
jgi:hypothetical protein